MTTYVDIVRFSWGKRVLLLFMFLANSFVIAQETEDESLTVPSEDEIIITAERYKPRPTFLELSYESFQSFFVKAKYQGLTESAQVEQNLVRKIKFRFPIILKERMNLIGGFGYRHEQFKFENQSDPDFPLFVRFEDKPLKQIAFKLYFKKDLEKDRFLYIYLQSSLNSDVPSFNDLSDQLKLSLTSIYGKYIGPHKSIGYGISFGYDFGRPAIYPVFILNNNFNLNWGYELLLPKKAQIRYSPNNSNHFYTGLEVQGASYNLRNEVLPEFSRLEFRRSSIRALFTYEREVYDWVWVSLKIGYRYPINIYISEPRKRRKDALILLDANGAPYLRFSIFLVPPKVLVDKAKTSF
ncbi:hypothetical protein OO013_03755 [Mangrovivirga sp. M17]|uniref:DUF3078 domain-containing protein n=1 Tax=Mangrovivirga halotolerans TaxID=2993936 RepID=A0ABT3RMZ9_9BACT|nr:hypothetical protein [Mangrovivirga halotolerans]MCX2742965.1 hypothetical protein [Mangrovivirga halotolerans]